MTSANQQRPIVLITGVAGQLGSALKKFLGKQYRVVGLDLPDNSCDISVDLTSAESCKKALEEFKQQYGHRIAGVIHLAAYFDFSGKPSPLYDKINCQGTRNLLQALQDFDVERFIYSSTMLVHRPGEIGEVISESTPVEPQWAYPQSKAETEQIIREEHGNIPYVLLRLAGLYDEQTCVPTLSHQIARIYEHNLKSLVYAGDLRAGQSFIHRDDMLQLFKAVLDKRNDLDEEVALLAGEPDVVSYDQLQKTIGELIHGRQEWRTVSMPKPLAKAGAWLQEKAEPVVPDDIDKGEKPFVRPFMIDLASDHYALDISKARELLDWQPQKRLIDTLSDMVDNLKNDPLRWYQDNGITPPDWMQGAADLDADPETLRRRYEKSYQEQHRSNLWAHLLNIALGFWLITSPWTMGYESTYLTWSDTICGLLIIVLGTVALSPRPLLRHTRWLLGGVGMWLLFAPLLFWAPTAASYLNDTLIGTLVIAFALLVRPLPGISPLAATTGPDVPPGWDFSPSTWAQRLPIIILAFVGFFISRYLTAYQLGHIDSVWEPFFAGALPDAKNGTEEIITSSVSEAWPVPDAGIGALTYLLEILTGIIGSRNRWRTMPWLVLLFGFMIVPLGAISITFIIIQPIILDTWCTLCLVAAAAMLLQIPYSFDEIVATLMFLRRRAKAGRPWLLILFTGDTDEPMSEEEKPRIKHDTSGDNLQRPVPEVIKEMLQGGISVPWNLAACTLIGVWLLFTRMTVGSTGTMADADHLIGSLVLTVTITAFAEVMRSLRFLNIFLGLALLITPFIFSAGILSMVTTLLCGLALIVLSIPRGGIACHYGTWSRFVI
jgi:nucleoside-diphosphate-sugar epimerase